MHRPTVIRRPFAAAALAGFAALAGLLLWPAFAPVPADRLLIGGADGDFLRQFYPYRAFVARALAGGHMPLWNPHQYAGTPALADPQLAVAYPARLLQALAALGGRTLPVWTVSLEAAAHLALAGWFAMLLARAAGAGRGATLAGIALAAGGYATGYPLDQLAVIGSAAWIPAALAGLERALGADEPGARRRLAAGAGAASALSLLAGHGQTAAFGGAACLALAAWRARRVGARAAAEATIVWVATGAVLSTVQWLPTLELLGRASRVVRAEEAAAGLPVADLGQLLVPHLLSCWSPLYVGVVPLALALWGARAAPRTRFWLALAAGGWLWSLGGNGPLVPLALRVLPLAGAFRHQERAAVLVALGLAVAAGIAAGRAAEEAPAGRARGLVLGLGGLAAASALGAVLLAVIDPPALDVGRLARFCAVESGAALAARLADGLALAALWLGAAATAVAASRRGALGATGLATALALVAVLELSTANGGRALRPAGPWPPGGPLLEALAPRARDGRVSSEGLLPGGPNAASVHGFFDATGDSPLALAGVADLVEEAPEIAWWRLLGVRYLVSRRELGPADAGLLTELARDGDRALYEIALPAPPAWAVAGAPRVEPATWRPDAAFDPLAQVVLTDGPTADPGALPAGGPAPATTAARLEALDPGVARVVAELEAPGALVLSTAWDPGWRARAVGPDGRAHAPVVRRAYGALLAVELGPGTWRVEWTYRPRSVMVGAALAGLGWALLAAASLIRGGPRWSRRLRPERRG